MAREYLAGRGTDAGRNKNLSHRVCAGGIQRLRDRLSKMADAETLRASGLVSSKEQGDGTQSTVYDRFRKRIMFPIANEGGR